MPPTGTPARRETRSNSASSQSVLSINDVKKLLDDCKRQMLDSFQSEIQKITDILTTVNTRMVNIEAELNKFDETARRHEVEINSLKSNLNEMMKVVPQTVLQEAEDRMFRLNNVIVSGIQESDGSMDDRIAHDSNCIDRLLDELMVKNDLKSDVVRLQRVGRSKDGKPRMLRIVFNNIHSKITLLQRAKSLRNSHDFKGIFINPDRTRIQTMDG